MLIVIARKWSTAKLKLFSINIMAHIHIITHVTGVYLNEWVSELIIKDV